METPHKSLISNFRYQTINLGLAFFFILITASATAQQPDLTKTNHFVTAQFGVNQIRDENLHPKTSTGTITELSYGFEKRSTSWQHFNFGLEYSRLKTEFEDLSKSANLKLNLSYSHSFALVRNARFSYYLGPEASVAYTAAFLPNWDDSHFYWANYFSLGVQNMFTVNLKNNNEWVTSIAIPMFSVFSRPELYRLYKIDDTDFGGIVRNLHSNLSPGFWGNTFHLKLKTEFRFPVFNHKKEAFYYAFEWLRMEHREGNVFVQLSHQIGIKLLL